MNINLNTFTSFTTSNCYVLQPFGDQVCIFIDLPPDLDEALSYVKQKNLSIGGALITTSLLRLNTKAFMVCAN